MRLTQDGADWDESLTLGESDVSGEANEYWGCQITYSSVCKLPGKVLLFV